MSKYCIFAVSYTRQCYRDFNESHGMFVPVERKRYVRKGVELTSERLLLPGLAFVPMQVAPDFRRRATRYNAQQLFTPINKTPQYVEWDDLVELQRILDAEYDGRPAYHFDVGDVVEVYGFPNFPRGISGKVCKFKSNGDARVLIYNKFAVIPKRFLRPVLFSTK